MARAMWLAAGLALVSNVAGGDVSAQVTQQLSGVASYYGENYTGPVASGPLYDPKKFTAAHRNLPFGTRLHVTDSKTQLSVDVVVTDRGPFIAGRMLDLSFAAAAELHMIERGLIDVTAAVH